MSQIFSGRKTGEKSELSKPLNLFEAKVVSGVTVDLNDFFMKLADVTNKSTRDFTKEEYVRWQKDLNAQAAQLAGLKIVGPNANLEALDKTLQGCQKIVDRFAPSGADAPKVTSLKNRFLTESQVHEKIDQKALGPVLKGLSSQITYNLQDIKPQGAMNPNDKIRVQLNYLMSCLKTKVTADFKEFQYVKKMQTEVQKTLDKLERLEGR